MRIIENLCEGPAVFSQLPACRFLNARTMLLEAWLAYLLCMVKEGEKDGNDIMKEGSAMEFTVSLDLFEGPLDLMLHLVRKNKLDLFELDLEKLAKQYCSYIRQAVSMQMEVGSEYLEECTILMEAKSRKLLPRKKQSEEPAGSEQDPQEDPAAILQKRLLAYEQVRKESEALEKAWKERCLLIDRAPIPLGHPDPSANSIQKGSLSADKLMKAMQSVLMRQALLHPYQTSVEVREISTQERMDELRKELPKQIPVNFNSLYTEESSLHELIVTFLAILELIHQDEADVWTDDEEYLWISMR